MKTLSYVFLATFLLSCTPEIDHPFLIGDSNKTYTIVNPEPAITITLPGRDSLDLNSDGIYEIIFRKSKVKTITGTGYEAMISMKNNLQILLSGLNHNPDTLRINTVLNNDSIWSEPDSYSLVLHRYACYTYFHCLAAGNFKNATGKYIGYKIGENFGWILIDNSENELKIREYTVLK